MGTSKEVLTSTPPPEPPANLADTDTTRGAGAASVAPATKAAANRRGPGSTRFDTRWRNAINYLRVLVAGWLYGAAKWLGPQQMRLSD